MVLKQNISSWNCIITGPESQKHNKRSFSGLFFSKCMFVAVQPMEGFLYLKPYDKHMDRK